MTEYIILRKEFTDEAKTLWVWNENKDTEQASSAKRALAAKDRVAGDYVAVPARSWKPLTVKTETVTKTTIS